MQPMAPGVPPPPPPPPSPTSAAGTLFGKYQLGRLLGRGSFGKVHKARSLVDNSVVAVKIIDKAKTVDAAMEPRIVREIDAMRRLQNHPNILKIFEVMATKTKIYLVMELATGGELFGKISGRRKLKESVARRYFQQLVSALSFCHQNGVAHRDVKPQNLLLDAEGNLKVSDFGLAALPEQLRNGLLQTSCGTPAYTAPEVFGRRGYDGSKADAWSCGVILYVLLSGALPFDDSNLATMYKKIHRRDYQFPDCITKPARYLIYQLLDPNPETRMSMEKLTTTSWFRKSFRSNHPENNGSLFESDSAASEKWRAKADMVPIPNAFDIISLSSGLNLSGLFEATAACRKEKRFTTNDVSAEMVLQRVEEVGERLGFRAEKGKGWNIVGLGKKGKAVLMVQVMEIAPSLLLGEVKVVDGGVEFDEAHWDNLRDGLQDVVLSWHNNDAV